MYHILILEIKILSIGEFLEGVVFLDNNYKFYDFFDTFMSAIGPGLTQQKVGAWLFDYSEVRYGDDGVPSQDLSNYKNDRKPIPEWVKGGISCKPGTALVKRFQNGLRTNYKLVNPQETISKFTHIIEGASNITDDVKEKMFAYAKEETVAEFLAVLYAYSITNNLLDVSSAEPKQVVDESIHLMTYRDLLMQGLDSSQIAENLVKNDRALYPDIADDNEGTPEIWERFLSQYPETFSYLVDTKTNTIVGNWSIAALTDAQKEMARRGELLEKTFSLKNTKCIFLPGEHTLYVLNFSCNDEYRTTENFAILLKSFYAQLIKFAEQDIFFPEIYVNVFTPVYEAFWQGLGFRYITDNKKSGKIYNVDMRRFPKQMRNTKLRILYEEHFEL